jgi:hypothetical protein
MGGINSNPRLAGWESAFGFLQRPLNPDISPLMKKLC